MDKMHGQKQKGRFTFIQILNITITRLKELTITSS